MTSSIGALACLFNKGERLPKRKIKKQKKATTKEVKPSRKPFLSIWKVLVFLSVIGGLYIIHLSLIPKIYFEPDLRRISNNPFTTSFRIRNDGYLPITHLKFQYGLKNIYWKLSNNRIINSGIQFGDNEIKVLNPNQTETAFRLDTPVSSNEQVTSADIEIVVFYGRYWPPWRSKMVFGFTLTTASDGSQHWQHKNI